MKYKSPHIMFILCLFFALFSNAQEPVKKNYFAEQINGADININGQLDEMIWQTAKWENQFIQYEPQEGKPPLQQTEFALLYDEYNVYVGIKAYDDPDSISYRMTRRDVMDGDQVGIAFDTYHDHRTAFLFIVSAAGVRADFVMSNDGENEDYTWDPIWWVKTLKTKEGWNAEMRIPLTQLRFGKGDEQLWGLQVFRQIFRNDELSLWQPMIRSVSGFVSQFGEVNGFKNIQPKNTLDIMPYIVARTDRYEKEVENPFRQTGKENALDAGLDAKIGLTNYLTLDLTVNPDFGQVEADPSEVNLSTHETFFVEKRPFFIEGKNILHYKLMFGDGNLAYDGLFYSRRIGRKPNYSPDLADNEYINIPEFTKILGAAKVTGKTKTGWSVGILESVTAREYAEIRSIENRRTQLVEPLTNYFVTRLQKDFNEGNTYLGGMITAVNRSIYDEQLDFLHTSAYSGGIDFVHKWNNKRWSFDANLYFSQVNGSKEAIQRTQESNIRNFQRPDADYIRYDTTRTSLLGQGGKMTAGKMGGNLKFMGGVAWKSPGLEVNDIGYSQLVDNIFQIFWVGYRIYEPVLMFREINLNFNQWVQLDFGGNVTSPGGNINWYARFNNYWNTYGSVNINGMELSHNLLRGGPSFKIPGNKNLNLGFSSNPQKKVTFSFSTSHNFNNVKNLSRYKYYGIGIAYMPTEALKIEFSPMYNNSFTGLQYVDQMDYQNEKRYIFARIDRNTVSMSFRLNFNITPDLTIQYWGQPFIATGKYQANKFITNSKAANLEDRYQNYQPAQIKFDDEDEIYLIDENLDSNTDYSFDKPDFNVKEFLSNLVLRWEYRPGSTFFLVWSQTRSESNNNGSFNFSRDFDRLFDEKPHDVFLLKFSYRIGR